MLFYDFQSKRYFSKEESVLISQLVGLERKNNFEGVQLTWNDYFKAIGIPTILLGFEYIGGVIEFEIIPLLDCKMIVVRN